MSELDFERLLIHSVTDDTALRSYLPSVKKFLDFAEQEKLKVGTWKELDEAANLYLNVSCYWRDLHPLHGSFLMNGLAYLYPSAARMMPNSWRASQSWGKQAITEEGGPEPLEALACMEEWLRGQPAEGAHDAADWIALQTDVCGREQDMDGLLAEDVVESAKGVVLRFGVSSRGESSKAGRDQGTQVDSPHAEDIVRRRLKGKNPGSRIFKIRTAALRKWWRRAALAVLGKEKGEDFGPPHACRHTSASRDLAEGYRTFAQIQRRGRWKAADSVQRYAKTHAWFACMARLDPSVRARGEAILAGRKPRPAIARE
jgi:hypothetical protein